MSDSPSEHSLKLAGEWMRSGDPQEDQSGHLVFMSPLCHLCERQPAIEIALATLLDRELHSLAQETERLRTELGELKLADEQTERNLERLLQDQHERTLRDVLSPLCEGARCCFTELMNDDQNNAEKDRVLRVIRRIIHHRITNAPRPTGETK